MTAAQEDERARAVAEREKRQNAMHFRGGITPTLCIAAWLPTEVPYKNTVKPEEVDCPDCIRLMAAIGIKKP